MLQVLDVYKKSFLFTFDIQPQHDSLLLLSIIIFGQRLCDLETYI